MGTICGRRPAPSQATLIPGQICSFFGLCSLSKPVHLVPRLPKANANGIECDVCKELFDALDQILTNPTTATDMEGVLTPVHSLDFFFCSLSLLLPLAISFAA